MRTAPRGTMARHVVVALKRASAVPISFMMPQFVPPVMIHACPCQQACQHRCQQPRGAPCDRQLWGAQPHRSHARMTRQATKHQAPGTAADAPAG